MASPCSSDARAFIRSAVCFETCSGARRLWGRLPSPNTWLGFIVRIAFISRAASIWKAALSGPGLAALLILSCTSSNSLASSTIFSSISGVRAACLDCFAACLDCFAASRRIRPFMTSIRRVTSDLCWGKTFRKAVTSILPVSRSMPISLSIALAAGPSRFICSTILSKTWFILLRGSRKPRNEVVSFARYSC